VALAIKPPPMNGNDVVTAVLIDKRCVPVGPWATGHPASPWVPVSPSHLALCSATDKLGAASTGGAVAAAVDDADAPSLPTAGLPVWHYSIGGLEWCAGYEFRGEARMTRGGGGRGLAPLLRKACADTSLIHAVPKSSTQAQGVFFSAKQGGAGCRCRGAVVLPSSTLAISSHSHSFPQTTPFVVWVSLRRERGRNRTPCLLQRRHHHV
jgi:hypothetical protein